MNLYSFFLLLCCELLNNGGALWVHLFAEDKGLFENVVGLCKGLLILAVTVPLFLDVCFILL